MKTLLLNLMLLLTVAVSAQNKYEEGMGNAFKLWGEGKDVEASAMFERIGAAEKAEWLPDYYSALISAIGAFQTQDKEQMGKLIARARSAADNAIGKAGNNAELHVLQAMVLTAQIVSDPMTKGRELSPKVKEQYKLALALEPENPRAIFGLAEFELNSARYFGGDTTAICKQIDKAVELFATFKPLTPFHPKWGADRAIAAQAQCKNK